MPARRARRRGTAAGCRRCRAARSARSPWPARRRGRSAPKLEAASRCLRRVTPSRMPASTSWPAAIMPRTISGRGAAGDHHGGDRHRDQQREQRLIAAHARQHLGQQVVDDLHRRVDDVQPVAERPDRRLRERDATAGRRLDEPVQPAGAVDVARVAQPDRQRRDEHDHRGEHRQPGRVARRPRRAPGTASAASASGPPKDAIATPAKAQRRSAARVARPCDRGRRAPRRRRGGARAGAGTHLVL